MKVDLTPLRAAFLAAQLEDQAASAILENYPADSLFRTKPLAAARAAHLDFLAAQRALRDSDEPREFTARDDCEADLTFTTRSLAEARHEAENWVRECEWDTSQGPVTIHVWLDGEDGSSAEMDVVVTPSPPPEALLTGEQLDAEVAKVANALPALRAAAGGRPLRLLSRTELLHLIASVVD